MKIRKFCGASLFLLSLAHAICAQEDPSSTRQAGSRSRQRNQERSAPDPSAMIGRIGELMERDWKDKPEWAEMAISIFKGEPMGVGKGWFKASQSRLNMDWLKSNFDKNGDGKIEKPEISERFKSFSRLDRNNDGFITDRDLDWSKYNPLQPDSSESTQMFFMLDSDTNGKVSIDELQGMFGFLDQEKRGYFTAEDLKRMFDLLEKQKQQSKTAESSQKVMASMQARQMMPMYLEMLLSEQMGHLSDGPQIGDLAPEIDLPLLKSKERIKISDLRDKRIVVLNFGSFT
jgi:Ca2+-binding EF-hand superfamily protein